MNYRRKLIFVGFFAALLLAGCKKDGEQTGEISMAQSAEHAEDQGSEAQQENAAVMEVARGLISGDDNETVANIAPPVPTEDELKVEVNAANIKEMNDEVQMDGISWQIMDVAFTKKIGDRDKSKINYWGEKTDEDGNLTGTEEYVWITVKVKNQNGERTEIYMNNPLCSIDASYMLDYTPVAEARYISQQSEDKSGVTKFHCTLQPDEEKELELGYIIYKERFDIPCYYRIGSDGDPNSQYISLEDAKHAA